MTGLRACPTGTDENAQSRRLGEAVMRRLEIQETVYIYVNANDEELLL